MDLWCYVAIRLPVNYTVAHDRDETLKYSTCFSRDIKRGEGKENQSGNGGIGSSGRAERDELPVVSAHAPARFSGNLLNPYPKA